MKEKLKKICLTGLPVFLLGSSAAGMWAARNAEGFADWYGNYVYPIIVGVWGRLFGVFSFSVAEIGLYLLIISGIWYIASHIRQIKKVGWAIVFTVSALLFLYVFNCGINYSRIPFSEIAGLEIRDSSPEELYALCDYLTDQVVHTFELLESRMETESPKEDSGEVSWPELMIGTEPLMRKEAWKLGEKGVEAMGKLGEAYPSLSGFYPRPKPVGFSWILSVQQLSGIYSPFTIEANFNRAMTPYNIPHTICHELSHLKGFMREDEANFIGYLACIESDSLEYRYSGYLMGWIYATNALYSADPEAYYELAGRLPQKVNEALAANSRFWAQYEGKIAETANQVNDTYLKANRQEDGVKSYGRVVDLMLAYYRFSL